MSTNTNWKKKTHDIIYEADTPAGKLFDLILLFLIIASIVLVMLESVESYGAKYVTFFNNAEWAITILFTLEYFARIITIKKPKAYIFSFYGIIDFLSTIPKYLSFFFGGAHALVALRVLRLLRVFRVLKLARFISESEGLIKALKASRAKIAVFLLAVLSIAVILGSLMYLIETNQDSGFDSIPKSVYWAIVTLTTVGYGDIAPATPFGQFIASVVMILGYAIIAIPTGIVSAEYTKNNKVHTNTQSCPHCMASNHLDEADFCYKCGEELN
ncbi:MAG TPA: ion transporter [Lutibacter sp.]|nr:ion transporter [Lutibacter sp.]